MQLFTIENGINFYSYAYFIYTMILISIGFLEVSLSSMIESVNCISEGSFSVVSVQVVSHCGEGLLSNLVYALLGVAAMSRVNNLSKISRKVVDGLGSLIRLFGSVFVLGP